MVSTFGFGPMVSGFEFRRGLGIFSADNVSICSNVWVEIVVPPSVRKFQPTPAGFTATQTTLVY